MAYPKVNIKNSTNYEAGGTVEYASFFCSNDTYHLNKCPGEWTASSRGVCLVTKITAVVTMGSKSITAKPYTSTGTSYSKFSLIQTGAESFEVTRRVSGAEDVAPEDHVEPTEQQK